MNSAYRALNLMGKALYGLKKIGSSASHNLKVGKALQISSYKQLVLPLKMVVFEVFLKSGVKVV